MTTRKMHADELDIDVALVRQLVAEQFPQWLDLPIARVESAGTDNAIFRLGADLALRFPRRRSAAPQIDKEQRWLPLFAPHLPLAIPAPLACGEPARGFPWRWSVYNWLAGTDGHATPGADSRDTARSLAAFVTALARFDTGGGPSAGPHNFYRGAPLAQRDTSVRRAIAESAREIDAAATIRAWDAALAAPQWHRAPTWLHGDLAPGNLLFRDGRLVAVLDFGCLGVGDPACELMVAWNLLTTDTRATFRAALAPDDATWARGRGWALSSVVAIPYYRDTNPTLAEQAKRTIAAVLSELDP